MPTNRSTIAGQAIPGKTGVTLMARLRGAAGALVTGASLSSIGYTVSDLTDGTALGSGTFTVSAVLFDSLQQGDARWSKDSAGRPGADGAWGYNFLASLAATLFPLTALAADDLLAGPAPPHRVQCDVAFTPVSGQPFRVLFSWLSVPVYG